MQPWWKDWRLGVALLAYAAASALFYDFTLDDAGITLRYAYNLAHHGELVFNPGERVYGTTTILWAIVTAPLMWLDGWLDPLLAPKLLSFVLGLAGVAVLHRLARDFVLPVYVFFMATSVLAVPYVLFAFSAMELSLSVLLLALFVAMFLRDGGDRRLAPMAWLGIALFLTRPDFVLLTVPLYLVALVEEHRRLRDHWPALVPPAIAAVAVLAGLWLYYGSVVPLSLESKMAKGRLDPGFLNGLARIGAWGTKQLVFVGGAAALAWLVGSRAVRAGSEHRRTAALAGAGGLMLVVFMSQGGRVIMDDAGRYYYPALLLLALAAARVLDVALRGASARSARLATTALLAATPVAMAAGIWHAHATDMNLGTVDGSELSARDYARIMNEAYIPLGEYIHEEYPAGTRLLIRDAGLVPFYAREARVLDAWSLNEPAIVRCRRICLPEVIEAFDPDLVVQEGNHVDRFAERYRRVRTFRTSIARRSLPLYERRPGSSPP